VIGCQGAADCEPDEVCDPTGICRTAGDPCASRVCAAGSVCRDGACQVVGCSAGGCEADELCDPSGVCRPERDACASAECPTETVCRGDGGCEVVHCAGAGGCGPGEVCDPFGVCRPPADACGSKRCEAGEVCRAGACAAVSCAGAATCAAAELCTAGFCAPISQVPCAPDGGLVDTETDPFNCGGCGHVCPAPLNTPVSCSGGLCGRGPCQPGTFDLDGPATFGCEATCAGATCTLADGGSLTLGAPPLPETGLVAQVLCSGGALPPAPQTNARFTNYGVLGEPTPPLWGGAVRQRNATFQNIPGFMSVSPR